MDLSQLKNKSELELGDGSQKPNKALDKITPEELEKLQKIMGGNFKISTKIEQPESALGFVSSHHKYQNDNDLMKQKLKNMKKNEEQRQKQLIIDFQKKNQ